MATRGERCMQQPMIPLSPHGPYCLPSLNFAEVLKQAKKPRASCAEKLEIAAK
jgi:hypothetical protein